MRSFLLLFILLLNTVAPLSYAMEEGNIPSGEKKPVVKGRSKRLAKTQPAGGKVTVKKKKAEPPQAKNVGQQAVAQAPSTQLPLTLETLPRDKQAEIIDHILDPMILELNKELQNIIEKYPDSFPEKELITQDEISAATAIDYYWLVPAYILIENIVQFRSNFLRVSKTLATFKNYIDTKIVKVIKNIDQNLKNALLIQTVDINQNIDVADLLLACGANFDSQLGNDFYTAIDKAIIKNSVPMLEFFIKKGAVLTDAGFPGFLLSTAVEHNSLEVAKFLIEKQRVNPNTYEGFSPLHEAAEHGYVDMAKLLILHGAKIDAENFEGKTPLTFAALEIHKPMVEYLLSLGANPNIMASIQVSRHSIKTTLLNGMQERLNHGYYNQVLSTDAMSGTELYNFMRIMDLLKKYGAE